MGGIRRSWLAAGVVALLCFPVAAKEWTDSTGTYRTEAEFVEVRGQTVLLKKTDGVTISVPLDRLSQTDRDFIKQLATGAAGAGTLATEISFEREIRPLIKEHCGRCHGAEKAEGDVNFSLVADRVVAHKSLTLWRKAAERID